MALDATDIERLRAVVPDRYQPPRDAGGILSHRFSSLDAVRDADTRRNSALDRHNLGMSFVAEAADNPDIANPSFLLTGAQAIARAVQIERQACEERDDIAFALEQMHQALDRRLAALDAELEAIDRRLEDIRQRRIEIGQALESLDELSALQRSGKLDPANSAHARLLRRAGITPEEAARADIADIIAQRRRDLGGEDNALESEWNAHMKRRAEVVTEREAVIESRSDIENADTAEARILAERRAATVLGAKQLGEAASQTTSQSAKMIAADAVAASEAEAMMARSEAHNRLAVAENASAIAKADVATFKLGG